MGTPKYTEIDYAFMNSLSSAVLEKKNNAVSRVIKIWLFSIFMLISWAYFAEIDEITRGDGDVVPYGKNQIIQNLEGGIVSQILVKEGEIVKKGQVIIKINNQKNLSTSAINKMKEYELIAKKARLTAEAINEDFKFTKTTNSNLKKQLNLNYELYKSNKAEKQAKDNVITQQIEQKKQELKEAKSKIKLLRVGLRYINQEISMSAPLVAEGIKPKIDFLKLKREANGVRSNIESIKLSLPRLSSLIKEVKEKRKESTQMSINKAKQELNEVTAELERLKTQQVAYNDQVSRTKVVSPVNGVVQKLFFYTVGGVIQPGADLVEIVPIDKKLILQIKIQPKDIAFIHPGAEVKIKITAYDFALHGGLIGHVTSISPDTITDKQENTFYLINVETTKKYLGTKAHPLKIIPGMKASADILTGKKTILQYILKPILKSKNYVFTDK